VAELAQCPIAHIESVWAELSSDERTRLQPLLAEASGLIGRAPVAVGLVRGTPDAIDSLASSAGTAAGAMTAQEATQLLQSLPEPLAIRLLASIDAPAMRLEILDTLPAAHRAKLAPAQGNIDLTQRAKAAWLAACKAEVVDIPLVEAPEERVPRNTLFDRLRNWAGKAA
jgi:hypothetical protein